MATVSIDFETRSVVDLKKCGAHAYAAHESTRVLCMGWRKDSDEPGLWRAGVLEPQSDPFPQAVLDHLAAGGRLIAHNAAFEYLIWNKVLRRQFPHLPYLPIERWYCTMAAALACGLPGGLDHLAMALRLNFRKDPAGHRAMLRLCKPKAYDPDGAPIWVTDPALRDALYAYCKQDVEVERAAGRNLPVLSKDEQQVWFMDQRINERGVAADVAFCTAAMPVLAEAKERASRRIAQVTGYAVTGVSQTKKLVEWINAQGIPCESVAKGEVEDLQIEADLQGVPAVREALAIRLDANKASTAKYAAFINGAAADGRLRGTLQYHGAATGRWSGRRVQPQNFVRVDWDEEADLLEYAIELVKNGSLDPGCKIDLLDLTWGVSAFFALSRTLRPTFTASAGHRLIGGDWSNIEGRLNAWLAGEHWKLRAFEAYDRKEGPDLYKVTAAGILRKDISAVTKPDRQRYGKIPELACGYQGGVRAFQTMGRNLGVDISDDEAKTIVDGWRERNEKIKWNWYNVQDAAIAAVRDPGYTARCCGNRVAYAMSPDRKWLVCTLPSGRQLRYREPFIEAKPTPWGELRDALYAWGLNPLTKKWEPHSLYGGLLVENLCQAISACILRHSMRACESAGLPVVLTVHDELVCEVPEGHAATGEDLKRLMIELPAWTAGLPIAAECWEGIRYGK